MIVCNYRLIITQRSLKIPPESCVVCAEKKKSKVGQGRSFAVLSYQKIIWNCMFQRNNIQLQEVKWCFKQKYWKQLKKIIFTERKRQLPTEFKDKNKKSLLMIMNQQVHEAGHLEFHPITNSVWCGDIYVVRSWICFLCTFYSSNYFVSALHPCYSPFHSLISQIKKFQKGCTFDLWIH